MKWVTSVPNPEVSKMLQDLIFKKYPATFCGGYREKLTQCVVNVLGFSDNFNCHILQWTSSEEGINHRVFDDFEKISLDKAIQRLSPIEKFRCKVIPETTALLQQLAFTKGFNWSVGPKLNHLNSKSLLFSVPTKTLYIAGGDYKEVSVDEAIKFLGELS